MRAQRQPRDHPEAAAPAALEPPEELRLAAGVRDAHRPVGGHDLRLEEARRRHAVALGEAAEAATLDQPGHPDGHAAAALDVAAAPGRDRVVDLPPDRARLDSDRRLRRNAAPHRHERVVQRHRLHSPGPDQQRIRRTRGPLVAVAAALHHQPQVVLAGEVDRRDHVRGALGRDGIDTRPRRPGADPAERLGQPRLVAEEIGVLELSEQSRAVRCRRSDAGIEGRAHCDEPVADPGAQALPVRLGRPPRLARSHARRYSWGAERGGSEGPGPQRRADGSSRTQKFPSIHRALPS